jgi:RNA polymerase sigma-70 factor (ECF subfamily)
MDSPRGVPDEGPPAPRVLGDVLYADPREAVASETDWVGLVDAVAAGDQRALHTLFERTHRLVFTLSVRITNNRETADEVTLDVFHDVWRRAAQYDPRDGSVVGWIMNQARSRAIDRLRFEQRRKRVPSDAPHPETMPHDPQGAFDLKERGQLVRTAVASLTPEERQTIETAFFSELTHVEVAAALGQPLGTVKTRIRSGLTKLRAALAAVVTGP